MSPGRTPAKVYLEGVLPQKGSFAWKGVLMTLRYSQREIGGRAPIQMGMTPWDNSVMAMAQPMTSWMSLPMMAISAIIQRA